MAVIKVQFANSELEVISIKDDSGQLWMLANPFARILEYSNAPKAISTYVRVENQKYFEEIRSARYGQTCMTSSCVQAKSKFINRAGLFELIQASRIIVQ
uniref:BRO-B protein n=2 Tax=Helicoverpa armigera SNPV TaxID=991878 RepID=A0A7L8XV87_9ABAC|nr:BRO-B protein [Helicoverpa armigera SNPV]